MSGLMLRPMGIWDRERVGREVTRTVGEGDRVMRLHNGMAVGTVVEVDEVGAGFTVLLDEPTNQQWDKTRGRIHYDGLTEGRLYIGMSAQAGHGGRRSHGIAADGCRLEDVPAVEHRVMVAEVLWDDELRSQRALFG